MVPSWASQPFEDFRAYLGRVSDLLHLSREGIQFLGARPHLIEWLNATGDPEKALPDREMQLARRNARLAEEESAADYPLLHSQAAILLWSSLEALVRDFLTAWLGHVPEARRTEALSRTKVRLGDLESLEGDERFAFMLDALEESLGTRRAGGVERFEVLFRALDLSSPIDASVSRPLFELAQIRHVLVHRRGIADAKFVTACATLGYSTGQEIKVSHADYHRYFDAADLYVFELIQRVQGHFGMPAATHKPECRFFDESGARGGTTPTVEPPAT